MAKTKDIIDIIEKFAPLETMQSWDNSGWQINLGNEQTNKILTALSITDDVINQAVKHGCDLIISHHPVIFSPLKKIEDSVVINAVKNNIQIYSAHTNLDSAMGGTTDLILDKLSIKDAVSYNEFVRIKTFEEDQNLFQFLYLIKDWLDVQSIKLVNTDSKTSFKKAAFCAGAGSSFINELQDIADIYVTGDVKYHDALAAKNLTVVNIGHFDSEKSVSLLFQKLLENINIEIINADEKNIWEII